ncbi:MAG TPA: GlsB/YeaQ/YmgE family stress response membrane protein [Candidatus Tyrphobacter sp.]
MSILSWVIFGFIVGATAKWIVPGNAPAGLLGDIVIGIVGAFIGGWLFHLFGHAGIEGFWNWHSWLVAIIGAVVLLWAARVISGRRVSSG